MYNREIFVVSWRFWDTHIETKKSCCCLYIFLQDRLKRMGNSNEMPSRHLQKDEAEQGDWVRTSGSEHIWHPPSLLFSPHDQIVRLWVSSARRLTSEAQFRSADFLHGVFCRMGHRKNSYFWQEFFLSSRNGWNFFPYKILFVDAFSLFESCAFYRCSILVGPFIVQQSLLL